MDLIKLKIIGDITCDVDGSIPTTIKSTTIEEPNFFLNTAYKTLYFVDPTTFLFFLGLVAFTLLIVSLTFYIYQ